MVDERKFILEIAVKLLVALKDESDAEIEASAAEAMAAEADVGAAVAQLRAASEVQLEAAGAQLKAAVAHQQASKSWVKVAKAKAVQVEVMDSIQEVIKSEYKEKTGEKV